MDCAVLCVDVSEAAVGIYHVASLIYGGVFNPLPAGAARAVGKLAGTVFREAIVCYVSTEWAFIKRGDADN
mgnify:CR=1 FL=1